jgi:transposase-like protein
LKKEGFGEIIGMFMSHRDKKAFQQEFVSYLQVRELKSNNIIQFPK